MPHSGGARTRSDAKRWPRMGHDAYVTGPEAFPAHPAGAGRRAAAYGREARVAGFRTRARGRSVRRYGGGARRNRGTPVPAANGPYLERAFEAVRRQVGETCPGPPPSASRRCPSRLQRVRLRDRPDGGRLLARRRTADGGGRLGRGSDRSGYGGVPDVGMTQVPPYWPQTCAVRAAAFPGEFGVGEHCPAGGGAAGAIERTMIASGAHPGLGVGAVGFVHHVVGVGERVPHA